MTERLTADQWTIRDLRGLLRDEKLAHTKTTEKLGNALDEAVAFRTAYNAAKGEILELQGKVEFWEYEARDLKEDLEAAQRDEVKTRIHLADFDEVVKKISALEDQLAEAVARADVADYSRDAVVHRCRDLERRLAEFEVPA